MAAGSGSSDAIAVLSHHLRNVRVAEKSFLFGAKSQAVGRFSCNGQNMFQALTGVHVMHNPQRSWHKMNFVLLAMLVLATSVAVGDDNGDENDVIPAHRQKINFDFPGGTIPEFVDALREEVPQFNVVLMPGADAVQMPQITVRKTPTVNILQLIDFVQTSDEGMHARVLTVDPGLYTVATSRTGSQDRQPKEDADSRQPALQSQVFSIARLVDDAPFSSDDVLRGIEAALEIHEGGEDTILRFHEATRLLIVRGTYSQISLVELTINRLLESQHELRARQEYILRSEHEEIIRDLEVQYERLQRRAREMEEKLLGRQ